MNADAAMYSAKEDGIGACHFFSSVLHDRMLKRLDTSNALHRALENNEFSLVWQPQVSLETGTIIGAEVLLRWKRDGNKFIPPAEFIPIAEEVGLIGAIGDWVLREACRHAVQLETLPISPDFRVAVNFSPMQLKWHKQESVLRTIEEYGLDCRRFKMELTENSLFVHKDGLLEFVRELGNAGVQIAIDDFGTGYSNLSSLKHLPVSELPFEVVYYPRASTPEFCVKASLVKMALQMQWYSGMRFKMAFETDDSSRVSWFMGTISTAQVVDPVHWPDSPWRLLQVTWDEPELLQNVRRINPWLVELVSNMSTIHLSPFSPPQKKLRLPQHPEFSLNGQYPLPAFLGGQLLGSGNLFGYLHDNTPAGMQGARQAQYGLSLSDFYLSKLQSNFFQTAISKGAFNPNTINPGNNKNVSCLQTIGNSVPTSKNSDNGKKTSFVLFGQPILTEQQISQSKSSSEGNSNKMENTSNGYGHTLHQHGTSERLSRGGFHPELDLEASHCKVFMEYEDVGRTVNLSLFGSYEELCKKLKSMFDIDSSGILNHVFYQDVTGAVRQLGDEPFSDFTKSTRRLRILMDTNNENVGM